MVRREALATASSLAELLESARATLASVTDPVLYERALSYLYLSETRSSFAIEKESPSSDKRERFVQLLRRAGETQRVSEDWLVSLQNAVVRDVFSHEASYRTRQNWLENADRITFFPVPQEDEIPRELAWLSGYDKAFELLNDEFDLPRSDLSALIRMAQSQQGTLSINRPKQYAHLPENVFMRIEEVVTEAFGLSSLASTPSSNGENS